MSKVAIVTDSTSNIPEELLASHSITQIPLQLIWGDDTYRDGIDINPLEFYTRLKTAKVMPTSSQPSPADFERVYRDLLAQGYDIVSVHISSKLSGTMDSAIQAKTTIGSDRIALVDSQTTSMALGYSALVTARAAKDGASFEECHKLAEYAVANTGVLFVVSTLEFLHRGGRIGGASAFVGTAFGLKPILTVRDGKVDAQEKIRTMKKALNRLSEILVERVGNQSSLRIAAIHANASVEAENLLQDVMDRFDDGVIKESLVTHVSPVIGTHTGPGTVGITYLTGV